MHNRRKCIGLQALFCCRHLLPSSCRGDTDPANTKGLWSGPTASPGAGRGLARPQPNQGHQQCVVALGRLGDTRHRWLSPGPLPAPVARHRAAFLLQPRGSRGSPRSAAELGRGLGAADPRARQHQQPRGCSLLSLLSPSPTLTLPLSQEALSRAEHSLGWGSCCPAPRPSPGLRPAGMPPRRVPAAEPQQPPQPV